MFSRGLKKIAAVVDKGPQKLKQLAALGAGLTLAIKTLPKQKEPS